VAEFDHFRFGVVPHFPCVEKFKPHRSQDAYILPYGAGKWYHFYIAHFRAIAPHFKQMSKEPEILEISGSFVAF
jgi:hypothetical protein